MTSNHDSAPLVVDADGIPVLDQVVQHTAPSRPMPPGPADDEIERLAREIAAEIADEIRADLEKRLKTALEQTLRAPPVLQDGQA